MVGFSYGLDVFPNYNLAQIQQVLPSSAMLFNRTFFSTPNPPYQFQSWIPQVPFVFPFLTKAQIHGSISSPYKSKAFYLFQEKLCLNDMTDIKRFYEHAPNHYFRTPTYI